MRGEELLLSPEQFDEAQMLNDRNNSMSKLRSKSDEEFQSLTSATKVTEMMSSRYVQTRRVTFLSISVGP